MNLSLWRFSENKEFQTYFQTRLKLYKNAEILLRNIIICNNKNEIKLKNFCDIIFNKKKTLSYSQTILMLHLIKNFICFIEKGKDRDENIYYELIYPSGNTYDVLRARLVWSDKKIIDNVEHFGQNSNVNCFTIKEMLDDFGLSN